MVGVEWWGSGGGEGQGGRVGGGQGYAVVGVGGRL